MKNLPLLIAAVILHVPLFGQGACISLTNGVDGYIEIPYAAQLVPQGGITLEAWVIYDDGSLPGGWRYPTVARQNLNANQEDYFLRIEANNNGARVVRWKVDTSAGAMTVDWPFAQGQLLVWTHLAATYDGTTARLFVNGAEVASQAGTGAPIIDRGDVLRIGKGSDIGGPMEVWNGSIDEVRLWPFARTAGEIASAMNLELSTLPGLVSTWNFNNNYLDTSAGMHGTVSGAVSFSTATPNLQVLPFPGAAGIGAGTPGCLGPIEAAIASVPQIGNPDFAVVAQRVPSGAGAYFLLSAQTISPPIRILGIDVWLDPDPGMGAVMLRPSIDALGAARMALPVPVNLWPGVPFGGQFLIIDPCGPQGLTASNALGLVLL